MKFSKLLCVTQKESPREAELISHKLMLRAGLIQRVASGIYSYLPLGLKIVRKFEAIVREEMNKSSAQEVSFPAVVPAELWQQTGRWDVYGKELLRITDRHNNEFCFGPTHEEVVTFLAKSFVHSYKQLPLNLYQIQTKFRDEVRPRFGLMRAREFVMKDAYSFHSTVADLQKTYDTMRETYTRIFERCGLNYKIVKADSGAIGGDVSAEFMVLAESGEDLVIECNKCEYAANVEAAKSDDFPVESNGNDELTLVETPSAGTIKEVSTFLKVKSSDTLKAVGFMADEKPVVAFIRGDLDINELKLAGLLKCKFLLPMNDAEIEKYLGSPKGFLGPIQLPSNLQLMFDRSVLSRSQFVVGANKKDFHYVGAQIKRDFSVNEFFDFRQAQVGDVCSNCKSGNFNETRGIEVGHIFQLGKKYTEAMSAQVLDENGKTIVMEMGCYGIGIGRTVAASIEQNHDEFGIVWPKALAPFEVVVLITNIKDEALLNAGNTVYDALLDAGIDVLLDERKESAGAKFKDADLLGMPVQVIIGKSWLSDKKVDVMNRKTREKKAVDILDVLEAVKEII